MTRSSAEIVRLFRTRRNECSAAHARMKELDDIYENKVRVPLPELEQNERPAVTNWIKLAVDQLAMRVASVTPGIECPPMREGIKGSEENAILRRRALTAWWQENGVVDVQLSKRARWYVGYASAPAIVRPDLRRGIPVWELRDPRTAYPAENPDPAGVCPDDCIFAVKRRLGWITAKYPDKARALDFSADPNPDREFECIEYMDAEEHVLIALGDAQVSQSTSSFNRRGQTKAPDPPQYVELQRWPNLLGRCTAVIPRRISLNKPQGQFDDMIGLYKTQSRTMAMWILASDRAIFPDLWFIAKPGDQPQVLKRADGRAGKPGEVTGADMKEVVPSSAPQVMEMLQTIEQSMRETGGVPASFGGTMPSNIRTGKAGDQLMSNTVDFFVQEAQRVLGRALTAENSLAIDISRKYFGEEKKTFFITSGPDHGAVDYIPDRDFDSAVNIVAWPHAGADAASLSIQVGQLVGLNLMSKRTGREIHPFIDDAAREEERITVEALDQAVLQGIEQQIVTGQLGPLEALRIRALVLTGKKNLDEAYQQVHQEIQQQALQSQQGAQPQPGAMAGGGGPGGGPGAPPGGGGMPPGLAAPGVAAQLGTPGGNFPAGGGVPPPQPGMQDAANILSALRPRSVGAGK